MKLKYVLAFTLAASALVLVGCSSTVKTAPAAPGMINSKCPYSGGPANADVTSDIEGGKLGFCCAGCKGKFDKADAKTKADMVAKAKQ
jgi:hypothetical protein